MTTQAQQRNLEQRNLERGPRNNGAEKLEERKTWTPLVDVYETKTEIVAIADLPGVNNDGVKVEIEKGTLTIEGRRPEAGEGEARTYVRTFSVPRSIDADAVRAELQNGVLRVVLPKQDHDRPRQIAVKAG